MTYTNFGIVGSLLSGVVNTSAAAIPGIGIWHMTRAYRWPDTVKPLFYLAHIGVGAVFASFWTLSSGFAAHYYLDMTLQQYFSDPSTVLWRMLMGLFIYGCITGVCYAIHNYDRFRVQSIETHRLEALAAKAELGSLRARLNPHFIFNALHSISALMSKDIVKAEYAIEKLGYLLRYVLEEKATTLIPMREEWEFTKDYFEVENMRLENSVELEAEISDAALRFEVPPLLLQPLVENSMKHGRFSSQRHNHIKVKADVVDGDLQLCVADNGSGSGASAGDDKADSRHGLPILAERLELLYANQATLVIDNKGTEGFRVDIRIPGSAAPAIDAQVVSRSHD
jgi:hypothetical protein